MLFLLTEIVTGYIPIRVVSSESSTHFLPVKIGYSVKSRADFTSRTHRFDIIFGSLILGLKLPR